MNNLEKYLDQVIEQKPVVYEPPLEASPSPSSALPPPEEMPSINVVAGLRRRWYIVVATALVLCALALPAILLLVEPRYTVQGAVRVAPIVPGVITEEARTTDIGGYSGFVNTQALLLVNDGPLLQLIADDLAGRGLDFFSGKPQSRVEKLAALVLPQKRKIGPERILRDAISEKQITAATAERTELITVSMRSTNADEAKIVVDSFLRNYVARYGSVTGQQDTENLRMLDQKRDELFRHIEDLRKQIRAKAEAYGTPALAPRQEMEFNVQAKLMMELIQLESERIAAEANVELFKKTEMVEILPEQKISMKRDYINADPMVAELSKSIVSLKRELITQQALAERHPRLAQMRVALESLNKELEAKKVEVEQEFETMLVARQREAAQQQLATAQMDLERIKMHYQALSNRVNEQDLLAQKVGTANMDIQDLQFQLQVAQDQYDTLYRRIKILEMEQQRPARIETAYWADITSTDDRRTQLATAAVFGALACGLGLALLRDRTDKTLQSPDDVARQLDLPVLGTTTSSHALKPALFAEQIAGDYQTIRANLGLQYEGGMPRRLVVSSAGTKEGKTTFAVNLATSLAKSGKKVLLIDGDLRKPDVGQMLNIPKDAGYLQDVLLGQDAGSVAYVLPSSGLHVLAANPRHTADPYELLTSSIAAEQIERVAREYDHLVIDSPPVLAFPDALVWAKLADAVVLVGFAGHTTAPELKEARERFARGRARVLGAVLSNVPLEQNLYRYAHAYRVRAESANRKANAKPKKLLLASRKPEKETGAT